MRFTAQGTPYDICPVCHEMILPKEFGGKSHINGHRISEADRLFRAGFTIQQVNAQLSGMGLTLFANIPPQMRNVTTKTILEYDNVEYQMVGFAEYECIKLRAKDRRRILPIKLWDRRFLSKVNIK